MTPRRVHAAEEAFFRLLEGLSGRPVFNGGGGRTPQFNYLLTFFNRTAPVVWLFLFIGLGWHVALPYARPFMAGSEARVERIRDAVAGADASERALEACLAAEPRAAACAVEARAAARDAFSEVDVLTLAAHGGWAPGWRQHRSLQRASRALSVLCGLGATPSAETRCMTGARLLERDLVPEARSALRRARRRSQVRVRISFGDSPAVADPGSW